MIDSLKHEMPGVIASEPTQSKLARAEAVSPFIRAGNIHLPTSRLATMQREIAWDPDALILEATGFPNAAHDDQVDATSQALSEMYLHRGQRAAFLIAWKRVIAARATRPPRQLTWPPQPPNDTPAALRRRCQHRWRGNKCVLWAGEKPE